MSEDTQLPEEVKTWIAEIGKTVEEVAGVDVQVLDTVSIYTVEFHDGQTHQYTVYPTGATPAPDTIAEG
jgi:hypothetical protein